MGAAALASEPVRPAAVCLNGNDWTFLPIRLPFFGYELDAPGRWKEASRDHAFIRDAIADPNNNWTTPTPVRVPMAWSCAVGDPGSAEIHGDFDFPVFWQYVHQGVYERSFDVPPNYAGQRVVLHFSSVNLKCWVYVNNALITPPHQSFTHRGKHPFSIDITSAVEAGSKGNALRVVVQDFTDAFQGTFPNEDHPDGENGIDFPLGDRCDYYNKDRGWRNIDSGIIGDVMLSAHPVTHVGDVFVTTSVSDETIQVRYELRNDGVAPATISPVIEVHSSEGPAPALRFATQQSITLQPGESRQLHAAQDWSDPHLWWPHRPFLYDLTITLRQNDKTVDERRQRFGFREVKVVRSDDDDRRGFYLNGVRTRLFGESVEPTWKDGYTEGVGTSGLYLYNRAYWTEMIRMAKSMGINVLRPHRGMWTEEMFAVADEMGMMMIAESTINNGRHKGAVGTVANQVKAIRDMVLTLRNHPSVVVWGLANESFYEPAWTETALSLDSTRPLAATQTGDHPGLLGPGRSYAMGLNGYEPDIYDRHDDAWKPALMYVYEDNACYDQPTVPERVTAVQKGLTIFRGHRASGYELISTFYTFQKAFGQPILPAERRLALRWTEAEAASPGYRPDFATMPLFDPWTNPDSPRVLHPITEYTDNPVDYWRRSYSPVAVFDRDFDERASVDASANPYVGELVPQRHLTVHNDDLEDLSTTIQVVYETLDPFTREVFDSDEFLIEVPLGGVRPHQIILDFDNHREVEVRYRAFKSGVERFSETIRLGDSAAQSDQRYMEKAGGQELVITPGEAGFEQQGYTLEAAASAAETTPIASATNPGPGDYVAFNPWIGATGDYDVFVWIPAGLSGWQRFDIRHDTLNTTGELDLSQSGWVRLGVSAYRMNAGRLENSIRFTPGDTATRSAIGPVRIIAVE